MRLRPVLRLLCPCCPWGRDVPPAGEAAPAPASRPPRAPARASRLTAVAPPADAVATSPPAGGGDAAAPPAPAASPAPSAAPAPAPRPAARTRLEARLPAPSPWQEEDGSWHAAVHLRLHNDGEEVLPAGWRLGVRLAGALEVEQSWVWTDASLQDGQLSGVAAPAFCAIAPQEAMEVGAVLRLGGSGLRLEEATLDGRPCRLEGDVCAQPAAVAGG